MKSLRTVPRCHRLFTFLVFRKRLVFGLLFINLMLFIAMYVVTISSDEHTIDPEFVMYHDVGNSDNRIHAKSIHTKYDNGSLSNMIYPEVRFWKDPVAVIDHYQEKCRNSARPEEHIKENFQWQKVSEDTFIFSAYFDNRTSTDSVVIWGTTSGDGMGSIYSKRYCQVWYADMQRPVILWAEYEIVPETHGLRYAPAMFICRVVRPEPPYAVSLLSSKCELPKHVLLVQAPRPDQKPIYQFTVCVSPLNMHYDDIYSFTENMEINRMLGANKIVLYNHTTGDRLNHYLNYYIKDGLVDVIPWQIPVTVHPDPPDPLVSPEIHYFGQVVALNDCLYRYMYTSKYIVFTDLDEVLIPRQHITWNKMMKLIDKKRKSNADNINLEYSKRKYGAFMFRNVFFRIDWPDENTDEKINTKLKLRTQLKLRREVKIWDFYFRTKFIVLPKSIQQVGVHFVFNFVDSRRYQHKEVPAELGLLHHYRDWGDEDGKPENIVDTYMTRYDVELQQAVIRVHQQIGIIDINLNEIADGDSQV